ncbi:MAG: porin family protein [Gammaproteobacteria bacterium]|nr:porin family protein [Gammaproteobacteria bacterium]
MKVAVIACTLSVLFAANVMAETALQNDDSQRKYERKVQMELADIGMESRRVTSPIIYCSTDDQRCSPRGIWTFEVNKALEAKAAAELLERLAGKRYDLLAIKSDSISITSLSETVDVKANIAPFSFDTGSYDSFKRDVDKYLDAQIAPLLGSVLIKAKDARYQELPDKEKATFLSDIAKETSVPADVIGKLMNSAFVFSFYAHESGGSITITRLSLGGLPVFNISFSVSMRVKVLIHRFDAESGKFVVYDEIVGESGSSSASDRVVGVFPIQTSQDNLFERAYMTAAKAAGIHANTKLKEDDNFSIFGTIDEVDGRYFYSNMGENEDLRIDAPYTISQTTDNGKQQTGWSKVRAVADSDLYKTSPGEYRSQFQLVDGAMEYKDQLREVPWTGVFFNIGGGTLPYTLEKIDQDPAAGGGSMGGLFLGVKMDLGYMFNKAAFSEKWLALDLFLGAGGEDISRNGVVTHTAPTISYYGLSVAHRYNLGSGLYTGFNYGYGGIDLNAVGKNGAAEIDVKSGAFKLGANLGYMFSPTTEIFANVDYYEPVASTAEQKDAPTANADVVGGWAALVGVSFHIRSIGSLASMMR